MKKHLYSVAELNKRKTLVTQMIAKGYSIEEISTQLGLSQSRVKRLIMEIKWAIEYPVDDFVTAEWWGDIKQSTVNRLARYGCTSKEDVLKLLRTGEIISVRNIGAKSMQELYHYFNEDLNA